MHDQVTHNLFLNTKIPSKSDFKKIHFMYTIQISEWVASGGHFLLCWNWGFFPQLFQEMASLDDRQ